MDFDKARSIVMTPEGVQLGKLTDTHAEVAVLLGGLSMPKSGILIEKAKVITFDYIINADLAVEVLAF